MVRTFAMVGVMLLALSLPQQAAGLDQKPRSSKLEKQTPGPGSDKRGSPPAKTSGLSPKADTKTSGPPAKASAPPTKASKPTPSKTSGPPTKASEPPPYKKSGPPAKASGPPTKASNPLPSKKSGPPTKASEPPPPKTSGPPAKASAPPTKASKPTPSKTSGPPTKASEPPPSKKSGPPAKASAPPTKASKPLPSKTSGPPTKASEPPPAKKYGPPAKASAPPTKASKPPPSKTSGPPTKASEPPPAKKYGPPAKAPGPPPAKASGQPVKKSVPPPSKSSGPPHKAAGPGPKETDRKKIARDACWGLQPGDVCNMVVPTGDGGFDRRLSIPLPKVKGHCWKDRGGFNVCNPGVCKQGDDMCGDPHMQGLRGQHIDWSGVDGGWYCLVKDESAALHINIRLTAPLPEEFPDRQLVTGVSVISDGNSLVVEVEDPYTTITGGCSGGDGSVCLANGGLHATVNGQEADHLLVSTRDAPVADGIDVSSSNLPVECRQFGGDKLWAQMHAEMLQGRRQLKSETFEEWVLSFDQMAAPEWCAKYIAEHDLSEVQSIHAILKIMTRTVDVRLNAGLGHQGDGELNWDGRVLPDLEFWQMDIGLDGLDIDNPNLTGILGETARPVVDEDGHDVMEGDGAFRGSVEDYQVPGALGTDFALLA